jgi:Ni,Fe-hydrogenase III small subunit
MIPQEAIYLVREAIARMHDGCTDGVVTRLNTAASLIEEMAGVEFWIPGDPSEPTEEAEHLDLPVG